MTSVPYMEGIEAARQARERAELRDRFAIAALAGITAAPAFDALPWDSIATQAYAAADAMLAERDKTPEAPNPWVQF